MSWAEAKWTVDQILQKIGQAPNNMRAFNAFSVNKTSIGLNFLEPEDSYADGNLICSVAGVMVQLCDEGACYAPVTTDDNGVAEFFMEKDIVGAMTKVMMAAGYEFSTEYTMFAEGENTVTLTVTKTEG